VKVLIIAPHADDETLGCSIACQCEQQAGNITEILIITDRRRKRELPPWHKEIATKAIRQFHSGPIFFWKYAEGKLKSQITRIEKPLKDFLRYREPSKIYVPAYQGGHLEHDIISVVVHKIAKAPVYEYWLYDAFSLVPEKASLLGKWPMSFIANKDRAIDIYLRSGYLAMQMEAYKGKRDIILKNTGFREIKQFYEGYDVKGYEKLRRYIENS